MISESLLKLLFALSIFIIAIGAGLYPFKKRLKDGHHVEFPIGDSLATGVFLGVALLHMLPESNVTFKSMGYDYPFAYIITGAVFLIFLWFEHLGEVLYHHRERNHPAFALLAWSMLSLHSVMVGAALGLSHSHSLVLMLFFAIIAHKWAESFAIAVQLNKSSMATKSRIFFFSLYCLMTPAGILLGWFTSHDIQTDSVFDPILIAASAGTFLYLGTLHGLERCVMVQRCCNLRDFSFVIIGFLLMASVAAYV